MKITTSITNPSAFLILLISLCFYNSVAIAQSAKVRAQEKAAADVSYLADSTVLTRGDYLASLQKVFEIVNQVKVTTASFYKLNPISAYLTQDENAI